MSYDLSGITILMIDDEPDNLIPITRALTYYGAEVHHAQEGEAGLSLLKTARPDLVLLDLSMPGLDGWGTLKAIRAEPSMALLTIVAVTAHAMQHDKQRALDAGFDGYITKPFRPSRVLAEIVSYLPQKQKSI